MSLEYWELKHAPSEGDNESWQLKLKIPASELISFLNNLPGIIGEPSKIDEAEFNFRVYIYEVKPTIFPLIADYLKEKCPIGEIYDKTKKGAFESILDDLAQSLDTLKGLNDGKAKDGEVKPKEAENKTEAETKPLTKESPKAREDTNTPRASAEQNDQLSYKDISDIFNVNYDPQYTFSSYTASKAQEATLETIKSVANNPGTVYNPFFIQSGPGTGKTHILHAIAQQARATNNSLNIFFIDPELFIAKMSNSFKDGSLFYAKRYFLRSDILLVDNIELFKESVIYQKQIASIFRYLLELKKQIVITSRLPKEQLSFLDSKLFELVSSSHSVIIDVLDIETRLDIFKKILKASNMSIEGPQSSYIAPKLPSNYRSMEALVKRLKLYTSIKNDPLTNEILDKALSEIVASSPAASAEVKPAAVANPVLPVAAAETSSAPVVTAPVTQVVPVSAPVAMPIPPTIAPVPEPIKPAAAAPAPSQVNQVPAVSIPVTPPVHPATAKEPEQATVAPVVSVPAAVTVPPIVASAPTVPPVPAAATPIPAPIQVDKIAEPAVPPAPKIAAPVSPVIEQAVPAGSPIAAAGTPISIPVVPPAQTPSLVPPTVVPATPPASPAAAVTHVSIPLVSPTPEAAASVQAAHVTAPAPAVVPPAAQAPVPPPEAVAPAETKSVSDKKIVKIGLFYPAGYYIEAVSLRDNFKSCLTAHKFNFILDFVFLQQYTSGDFPYKIFSDVCLRNDAGTAIVLGFLKTNLSSSNIPSIEEIKMYLNRDPVNKSIFFEFIDSKQAGTDKPCLQYVLDIAISKDLK